ncbi:hypothetical protein [Marinimicrobium agarilyticum]|uniref:hypothetical protein n=1 Tax=Marinimicrobium agarilyticum TaxID=306546 RepID=UPI0004235409|nr:hypothetical protein [Marinimicrobium agarilyticum]
MTQSSTVTGEAIDHKLAAVFGTDAEAKKAAEAVLKVTSLEQDQVQIVRPGDTQAGWELEPEDRGIWRTLVRSHIWLGAVGAVIGLGAFLLLFSVGVGFVANNGFAAAAVLTALGAVFGLMAGGLVTLRPDHAPYLVTAQSALRRGKTVVAVHARNRAQLEAASKELQRWSGKTVSSF